MERLSSLTAPFFSFEDKPFLRSVLYNIQNIHKAINIILCSEASVPIRDQRHTGCPANFKINIGIPYIKTLVGFNSKKIKDLKERLWVWFGILDI